MNGPERRGAVRRIELRDERLDSGVLSALWGRAIIRADHKDPAPPPGPNVRIPHATGFFSPSTWLDRVTR